MTLASGTTLEEHSYAAKRASFRETMTIEEPKTSNGTVYGSVEFSRKPVESGNSSSWRGTSWIKEEFVTLFNLAWTMVICTVLTNLLAPIGLVFAGHLGIEELGGVALGNTVINIFGNAIGIGLSTACDTFFAQTYGSGNRKKVGVHLQRGVYVILLFSFPCWMILLNTESILLLLGQQPMIAKIAGDYIFNYMFALPAIFLFHIFSKYIRNQNIIYPVIFTSVLGVGATTLCAYLFVNVWDLRVEGCAWAQMVGFYIMTGGNIIYAVFSKHCQQCWDGFTWDALQDWGQFTSLAVYGMFMVIEQMGAFEVGTILAGLFGEIQLGAQTILFQIEIITYMVPIGVGIACNIRIGHLLGANDPKQTRRSIWVGYAIIWTAAAIVAIVLAAARYQIPMIFTDDEEVINVSANLLLIMALYAVFDGTVGTSGGMMRGCGRQRTAALITFIGYYIVGLPLGIALMFLTDLQTAGFWWGLTAGIITQSIIYIVTLVFFMDWEKMADEAQIRAGLAQYLADSPGEDTETDDERALLGSSMDRKSSCSTNDLTGSRKYIGEYDSSLPNLDVIKEGGRLTKREMVCRRGFTVLLCVLMLVVGIVWRNVFPPPPVQVHLVTVAPGNFTPLFDVV